MLDKQHDSISNKEHRPLTFWGSFLANFLGGFAALLAIMLVKLVITGHVL